MTEQGIKKKKKGSRRKIREETEWIAEEERNRRDEGISGSDGSAGQVVGVCSTVFRCSL